MPLDMLPPPTVMITPKLGDGVRELTPDEIKTVEHIFTENGSTLPDPAISTFVGCVENGEVVGFGVAQLRMHAQPFWVKDGKSDKFLAIAHAMEGVILQKVGPVLVYLFTPPGRIAQLAMSLGFQLEQWLVLSRLVEGPPPEPVPQMKLPLSDMPAEGSTQ